MKNILVPCDFSKPAINAYRMALDIARETKGEVHLVYVIELPVLHDTMLTPVLTFEEALFKELQEKTEKQFKKVISKYPGEGVKVRTQVLFGSTSRMLLDFVKSSTVDLVVMGTSGASGMKEAFLGSNAEKIVRHSSVPVLVVRKYVSTDSIRDIVFPNTLEPENQENLVAKIKALQHFFGAKLHIVWINTPTNFTRDTITKKRLLAFAKRYMIKDYTINIFNEMYEESGIINFTHTIKGALIAMGTHGRKGIAHVISGSLTEDIVNHIDVPIWTYTIK